MLSIFCQYCSRLLLTSVQGEADRACVCSPTPTVTPTPAFFHVHNHTPAATLPPSGFSVVRQRLPHSLHPCQHLHSYIHATATSHPHPPPTCNS